MRNMNKIISFAKYLLQQRIFFVFLAYILIASSSYYICYYYFCLNTKSIMPDLAHSCQSDNIPYCNLSEEIQFEKFVHFGLDGVSFMYMQPILDLFGEHAQLYTTYTNEVRYTQTVFRTWSTGRDNDNIQPFAINEDTIFHSFNRTYGKKIMIGGVTIFFTRLFKVPTSSLTYRVWTYLSDDPLETYRAFHWWLSKENKTKFMELINELYENNASLVSHDGRTDHLQHIECAKSGV